MKKLALTSSFALALTFAGAAVFANASDAPRPVFQSTSVAASGNSGTSIPAQLLTVTCNKRQGSLSFTEAELNHMVDLALREPETAPQVCKAFTLRV